MATYGSLPYGIMTYGVGTLPVSPSFDLLDLCHPTDAMMLTLLSYAEVTPQRAGIPWSWFNGSNDYCMFSNDEADSGFRIDRAIPNDTFTIQFSILPTDLPYDFSDTTKSRFFVAAFNRLGKMIGLLLSEMGGIALAQQGDGSYSPLVDSADVFDEGLDYYVFRITASHTTGRANLYVTRREVIAAGGEHELRYTFNLLDCPTHETDNLRVEVVGSATDPVTVCLDCLRLSSSELVPNRRPVAVISSDQVQLSGSYASFDGRPSYDPEAQPLVYMWSVTDAPLTSTSWQTIEATSPADATGYTNVVVGNPNDFAYVEVGDLAVTDVGHSFVLYVAGDGSYIVTIKDLFAAGITAEYRFLSQNGWGGVRNPSTIIEVLGRRATPPALPNDGDTYLVIPVAGGLWTGQEGDLATWDSGGGVWVFTSPAVNTIIYVLDEYETYRTQGLGLWYPDEPSPWELEHYEGRISSVGAFLGDELGLYTIELLVNDGEITSLPTEALLNVQETSTAYGYTPDLSFIWNYLSDFWAIVAGTEMVETFWSSIAQLSANELLKLWQHDYSKAVPDIQRTFQRRWLDYDVFYGEPNYDELPATVENTLDAAGYSAAPNVTAQRADGSTFETEYAYDLGVIVSGVTDQHYLVIDGICHKIVRVETNAATTVYTNTAIAAGVGRSKYWMIRPTVTSRASNFSDLAVTAGDSAIFEVQTAEGDTSELTAYVWGARGAVLAFDDSLISGYLTSSTYVVLFKGVVRRSAMLVDDLVMRIPRLQEVIAPSRVEGAPDPLHGNLDFLVETATTVQGQERNTIQFLNSWFPRELRGLSGYTNAVDRGYFFDSTADFVTTFGADADLRGYVLDVGGNRYRLFQVIAADQVELFDEALELNLTGQSWEIRSLSDVPDTLWAEVTFLDNRPTIEANFGRLVGFTLDALEERTDNLDYLSAVRGLWYFAWHGRTPYNIRVACQIVLGLPFAEVAGTITDIRDPFDATRSRILVQDANITTTTRSYFFPTSLGVAINPATDAPYTIGDGVEQFAPLSRGVDVVDYISDPDWWAVYAGSGDFWEPQKVSTFGVLIDADAFDLVNLIFLVDYIKKYKPPYLFPFFSVVKTLDDTVDIDDALVLGPAVPAVGYAYPSAWPAYDIPPGWADSPHEVARSGTPTIPPDHDTRWGGLHLYDVPGKLPDGWSGAWPSGAPGTHAPTRSEGSFRVDDTDESGHCIHKVDAQLDAVNVLLDADCEDGINPGGPGSPWGLVTPGGLPLTAVKSALQFVSPTNSIHIISAGAGYGVYQDYPALVAEGWQVAVRGKVYVLNGAAHFRIIDQDGATVLAELKKSYPAGAWLDFTIHAWEVSGTAAPLQFQILTGPGGGNFFVDDLEAYSVLMPWDQWGVDRVYYGRTGGYTVGGLPDEYWNFWLHASLP